MIGYLDTSAFVPMVVAEPSTKSCRRFWDDSDAVVSSRLLYVETAAALAQARRMDRLTDDEHARGMRQLDRLWWELDIIEIDETVVASAATLAHHLALRAYDAVHCASAELLNDADLVAAASDQKLLEAWGALGIATFDTNTVDDSFA